MHQTELHTSINKEREGMGGGKKEEEKISGTFYSKK